MRVSLIAVAVLAASSAAHADTGTLPGGMTVTFDSVWIHEKGGALAPPSDPTTATWHYFNLAHCQCSKNNTGDFKEDTFAWKLVPMGSTQTINRPADIWVGTSCDQILTRTMTCSKLDYAGISSIATMQQQNVAFPEIKLFDLMNPSPDEAQGDCQERPLDSSTWFVVDGDADGMDDYFASAAVSTDTLAPPLPTGFKASGGENAISISWDTLTDASDVYYYQALCSNPDGTPASVTSRPKPQYVTSRDLCGAANDRDMPGVDIDTGGGDVTEVDTPVDGLIQMNSMFLCGEQSSPTANNLKIEGLANGSSYQVAVLVMDKFGNARGTFFKQLLTPVPSTDFWEDVHGRGSKVHGGFCAVGGGDAGSLVVVLGALGLVVVRRRRRRMHRGALVAVAVLGFGITEARADTAAAPAPKMPKHLTVSDDAGGYDPFWNEPDNASTSAAMIDDTTVHWHTGIRIGPYTPQIDAQVGGAAPGPYKQMFGGYSILPMLDVEYVVWRGFGQVTAGGNIGFMSKKAHSFVDGSLPSDNPRMRTPSDTNTFRLIPFAATVGYRFTVLDDEYGIPLVPYAKLGLAYDIWWMKAPSGSLSKVCNDGSKTDSEPGCAKDTALGASLGVQGTIGLAIRAERIDSGAAKSMHESGLEHAGFYGELQLAKVDGFGSSSKLAVGDNTWFAGVDFEF